MSGYSINSSGWTSYNLFGGWIVVLQNSLDFDRLVKVCLGVLLARLYFMIIILLFSSFNIKFCYLNFFLLGLSLLDAIPVYYSILRSICFLSFNSKYILIDFSIIFFFFFLLFFSIVLTSHSLLHFIL